MSLITDNLELTEDFIGGFDKLAKKTQDEILKVVLDKLTILSIKRGALVFDDNSSTEINELIKQVYREFDFEKYQGEISGLLRDVDSIGKATIELTASLTPEVSDIDFTAQKKFIINEISERLATPESFKVNILGDVRRIIARRLLTQAPIRQLKEDLIDSLTASAANGGILGRYVNQITTDAVQQYKGSVNRAIKEKFDLDAYSYVGSLIKTSRPQCVRWINEFSGVLMIDERVKGFGYLPAEVEWAKKNGSGYGTPGKPYYLELTVDNFQTVRGGYACRHEATPFRMTERAKARTQRLQKEFDEEMRRLNIQAA